MSVLDDLGTYVLYKDNGHHILIINDGRPIIFQGADLGTVLNDVRDYLERKNG